MEIIIRGLIQSTGKWHYANFTNNENFGNFVFFLIDKTTLSQYIGMSDKNGVMIFVGDILKTKYGIGTVCWDEQYLHYFVLFDNKVSDEAELINIGWSKEIEIIGNIFNK